MVSTYNYSLSSDLSNQLDVNQLHDTINADAGITPTCLTVKNSGDVVTVIFDSALSGGEQTTLNGLISGHSVVTSGEKKIQNALLDETTATTYQTRDTLTTEYLSAGDYKIDWYYTFKTEDGTPDIRIIIDDTTVIHTNNTRVQVVSTTLEYDKVGFCIHTLTSGVHTIKLQLRGKADASTSIVLSNLFIYRIS